MNDEIKATLDDFHTCNEQARSHFKAYEVIPDKSLRMHTQKDLMLYSKWRTKADLALNRFHTLLAQSHPGKLPYSLAELEKERANLQAKLDHTETWLSSR